MTLRQVEQTIQKLPAKTQQKLLKELPRLLKIHPADFSLLKLAESAFEFWDNPEDDIYNLDDGQKID